MGLGSIIFIILVGLLLLILDFLVIPGIVISIVGVLCMVGGVVATFIQYGTTAGMICLLVTAVVVIGSIVLMMRSKTWRRLQLNTEIDSKMNEFDSTKIQVGATGKSISRLAPMGTGEFDGEVVEVTSTQEFIDVNQGIIITRIDGCKIYVKPL